MTAPKTRQLIILGTSAFSQVAYEYFTHDSEFEVVGFSVDRAYLNANELLGMPVVPFEELQSHFLPHEHWFYSAVTYTGMNRVRTRLYQEAKDKGFKPASYVSTRAFVWKNVALGEHCFVMEQNVLQPFVEVGNNVVLWSGNHIGHHSKINDHCFISSHVVVSGFCEIGASCFLGVNATIANNVALGKDCWIGPGCLISKNTNAGEIYSIDPSGASKVSTYRYFKVQE